MKKTAIILFSVLAGLGLLWGGYQLFFSTPPAEAADPDWRLSEDEWEERLSEEEFHVMRKMGTEPAFSGEHWDRKDPGTYTCAACGAHLFSSDTKFASGTGWPSFYEPIASEAIGEQEDNALLTTRTEVHCKRCGGHLGHVFNDGPQPTGLRYCINSVSLDFESRGAEATTP